MPRLLPVVLLLGLSACATIYRKMNDLPDPDIAEVAAAAASQLQCPASRVTATNDGKHRGLEWSAFGCSRWCACTHMREAWRCFAEPTPEWIGTDDEGLVLDMIDRLSLETACPIDRIQTSASFAASTQIGLGEALALSMGGGGRRYDQRQKDRAYRLVACGHSYVCSQVDNRTDCKAALADVERPAAEIERPAPHQEEDTQAEEQPQPQIRPPDPPIPAKKPLKKSDP